MGKKEELAAEADRQELEMLRRRVADLESRVEVKRRVILPGTMVVLTEAARGQRKGSTYRAPHHVCNLMVKRKVARWPKPKEREAAEDALNAPS